MINLLPLNRVISIIAVMFATVVALILLAVFEFSDHPTLYSSVKIALAGATILNAALLGFMYFAWERMWSRFPVLNTLLFPNLNGLWNMTINWTTASGSGVVEADASIKQNFVRMSMEVMSQRSDSESMLVHPKKDPESGRPCLYYVYRVVPKQTDTNSGPVYFGAAILKFSKSETDVLRGNYFTSQQTKGHFVLTKKVTV